MPGRGHGGLRAVEHKMPAEEEEYLGKEGSTHSSHSHHSHVYRIRNECKYTGNHGQDIRRAKQMASPTAMYTNMSTLIYT